MSNVVMFISFSLVKGASIPEFQLASEQLHSEFMSKQKGYISWKQLIDGDTWVDLLTWNSAEDAKNVDEASIANPFAQKFYSFIDEKSVKVKFYSVAKDYDSER